MKLTPDTKYKLTFPNGDKCLVVLKKINENSLGDDYIFEPCTEKDRVFVKHENWESLGWDSPWWFPIPKILLGRLKIEEVSGAIETPKINETPTTTRQPNIANIRGLINELDSFTIEEFLNEEFSDLRESALNYLLACAKSNNIDSTTKRLIIGAGERYLAKLKESMNVH